MFINDIGGRGRLMGGSILRIRTSSINFSQSGLLGDLGDITKTLRKAIQCSSLSSCSYGARKTKQNNHTKFCNANSCIVRILVRKACNCSSL